MKLRGGEFSTGTMGNFQPELTQARVAIVQDGLKWWSPLLEKVTVGLQQFRRAFTLIRDSVPVRCFARLSIVWARQQLRMQRFAVRELLTFLDMVTVRMREHCLRNSKVFVLCELLAERILDESGGAKVIRTSHVNDETVIESCAHKSSVAPTHVKYPDVSFGRVLPGHISLRRRWTLGIGFAESRFFLNHQSR